MLSVQSDVFAWEMFFGLGQELVVSACRTADLLTHSWIPGLTFFVSYCLLNGEAQKKLF